ncbi:MAG: purine-nucleoside phosphorylase [Saprospiraceae bacterium]|nr:purine-nucleoside phosphorylase [Saprospiraceae bacterium]
MESLFEKVQESVGYISSIFNEVAEYAIVLGTGLGDFEKGISGQVAIPYIEIPHFAVSTVESHFGQLIIGYKSGIPVIIMSGRFHYYEGYSSAEITFPVRVLKALGVKHIIFTNAAGGINPHYEEGDIVIVHDHINLLPDHPLRGKNDERLGPRFPDMLKTYNLQTIEIFKNLAKSLNIKLKTGVYLALQGPSLETAAEYRMGHILGADLVGMSTVPEVIVARHSGMAVTVFSIVSNTCYPQSKLSETTIEGVIKVVSKSAITLQKLLNHYFRNIQNNAGVK